MKKIWFRRKTYGWGWTPASWEGWLVMLVYFCLIIAIFQRIDAHSHSGSDTLIGFAVPFIALTVLLLLITYMKGEPPRWQWGQKDDTK
jgi:phosphatidylserine synthase